MVWHNLKIQESEKHPSIDKFVLDTAAPTPANPRAVAAGTPTATIGKAAAVGGITAKPVMPTKGAPSDGV